MNSRRTMTIVVFGLAGWAGLTFFALNTPPVGAPDDERHAGPAAQVASARNAPDTGDTATDIATARHPIPTVDTDPAGGTLPADQPVAIDSLPPDDARWARHLLRNALNSWDRHGLDYPKTTPLISPANVRALLQLHDAWKEKKNAADNAYVDRMRQSFRAAPEANQGILPAGSEIKLQDLWAKRFGAEAVLTGHSLVSRTKGGERRWVFIPRGQDPELDALEEWVTNTDDMKHEFLDSKVPQFFFWP